MAARPARRRRPERGRLRLLACRTLVALAAACFVSAFTVAALAPPGLSLGDGLQRLAGNPSWPGVGRPGPSPQHGLQRSWHDLLLSFLLRPAWLLPVMLGCVSAGTAISLGRPSPGGPAR